MGSRTFDLVPYLPILPPWLPNPYLPYSERSSITPNTNIDELALRLTIFVRVHLNYYQPDINPNVAAMSDRQTYSTFSSSSYSSNSDSSGNTFTQSTATNPSGTTVHTTSQRAGEPAYSETTHHPAGATSAQQVEGVNGSRRIEDVTDADREYVERMEDEYAKREGGA